ncbi:MAG: hypothetical protein ACQETB_07325 [Halobacteriota archaeon]
MVVTRRNTLIGLGTALGGVGLITSAGAFDTVEATRTFAIEVDADASALLQLSAPEESPIVSTETGGAGESQILVFSLEEGNGINENAITAFYEAFTIANNGSQTVAVSVDTGAATGIEFLVDGDAGDDLAAGAVSFTSGESQPIDVVIDTTTDGGYVDNAPDGYDMTITAEST